MDYAALTPLARDKHQDVAELRAAPRYTLLIRAAKLVSAQGEFVCVIRDVSETGVSIRLFHALPSDATLELHMPGGHAYEMRAVWQRANEAGFEFLQPMDVKQLVNEAGEYPKRGLRLNLHVPIMIRTLTQSVEGVVENLSQQGARFECDGLFAIQQNVRIESDQFKEIRAKVRWRRDLQYGAVFEDTFSLGDFARLAAKIQAPILLPS